MKWLRPSGLVALFGVIYAVIFWVCFKRLDPDFGWHIEAGRYIAAHGIPAHDVFSYTASSFSWINHEWLSDIVMYHLYNLGGIGLLAAFFAAIWTAALAVGSRGRWPVAALGAIGLLDYLWVRPIAITALFLAIIPLIWGRPGKRWLLVPLFLLWANLHGGFVLGIAIVGFLVVWERQWRFWWLVPASIVASFVNPYGPKLYLEIWRTLSDHSLAGRISEWGPLNLNPWNGLYIFFALAAIIHLRKRLSSAALMSAGLLGAAVWSTRQYMPFVIVSLPLVSRTYDHGMRLLKFTKSWQIVAVHVIVGWLLVLSFVHVTTSIKGDYPQEAAASLQELPCQGNVFNEYNFGGYLIWKNPGTKVYIDGRMPSWKVNGESIMDRWYRVEEGGDYAKTEFKRYNIQCAVVYTNNTKMNAFLAKAGFKPDVVGDPILDGETEKAGDSATLWRKK